MDDSVLIAVSTQADGSMSHGVNDQTKRHNRQRFLGRYGMTLDQTVLVHLKYEGNDYRRYYEVSTEHAGDGIAFDSSIVADALFTRSKRLALLLPIADCIAAVIYDPQQQILGLAHFGRHNLQQSGGTAAIEFMQAEFSSAPATIRVWLSPAAGRENYPLFDFNNRSLYEVALEQLERAGVLNDNVEIDGSDTTTNIAFFSHSEFLKGNRQTDGRQAVVTMMRP